MAVIDDLIAQISDEDLRRRIESEVAGLKKQKKFGLVFEEHLPECTPLYDLPIKVGTNVALKEKSIKDIYTVLHIEGEIVKCINKVTKEKKEFKIKDLIRVAEFGEAVYPYLELLDNVCNAPSSGLWHTLIEADNYHALQYLEYLYSGKVDCIYIDPPYNTGAKDWKYNNDYVDAVDEYRHSKWLSFIEKRLVLAKKLLNPKKSVLIITIDEKEYLHLGCLLEEMFKEARIQMVSTIIKPEGTQRTNEFSRTNEYIYFVMMGEIEICPSQYNMFDVTEDEKTNEEQEIEWRSLIRRENTSVRAARPNQFYPIFVNYNSGKIDSIGEALPYDVDRNSIVPPDNCYAVFPLNPNGVEMLWSKHYLTARQLLEKGYIKATKWDNKDKVLIKYLTTGTVDDIESGKIKVTGYGAQGEVLGHYVQGQKLLMPKTIWNMASHNSRTHGSLLIKKYFNDTRFDFPKSLYAVKDSIAFFVRDNKNALILDFFAGSGTTLQAVNLLNYEDGGNRRCIMVTNNEISEEESLQLSKKGFKPGDDKWNELGIARYITWPRTKCSILGIDLNNQKVKGEYLGTSLKLSDGFKTNANFFKLSFLDKNLVRLGRQFKEMIPTLWMKSGAIGPCPVIENDNEPMYIFKENKMAVLVDEKQFNKFEYLIKNNDIKTVFFVTDYGPNYVAMANHFVGYDTYQLYRDYLDNFKINVRRG